MNILRRFVDSLLAKEQSPRKLALSVSVGNYIAFSPYLGLHTVMVFVVCFIWNLNLAVTMATSYFINNPWTAIPIYVADYLFGYWLIHDVFAIEHLLYTPEWLQSTEQFLHAKLGIPIPSFWSFLIGGNALGIITSLVLYPVSKRFFTGILKKDTIKP
jgi:uncharacterized protein (DUF2062 family)